MKIELDTPDKPEVVGIATRLKIDQDAVTGKLFRIWAWADRNSVDGSMMMITAAFIDRLTGRRGFAAAMEAVGWLEAEGEFLTFPGFSRHNGSTAKARAESNRRMTGTRERRKNGCGNVAEKAQQKAQPEKRREESNSPQPPFQGESEGAGDLILKIKRLKRRWGSSVVLDARERRALHKNLAGWMAYSGEDWQVVGEFMSAALPEGSAYTQPRSMHLALSMPTQLLADAQDWHSKRKRATPALVVVEQTEDAAATAEEVAEIFRRMKA